MKYQDFRCKIKSGDILAWTHRSWKSWYDFKVQMVRLFTQSEYTHVGIAVVLGGRVWVLEAVTPKVRLVPLSNLLPCYHLVAQSEMTNEQLERGFALIGREEISYSSIEAIKALFNSNTVGDNDIQCVELVEYVLGIAQLTHSTPSALVSYMLDSGSTLIQLTDS